MGRQPIRLPEIISIFLSSAVDDVAGDTLVAVVMLLVVITI